MKAITDALVYPPLPPPPPNLRLSPLSVIFWIPDSGDGHDKRLIRSHPQRKKYQTAGDAITPNYSEPALEVAMDHFFAFLLLLHSLLFNHGHGRS